SYFQGGTIYWSQATGAHVAYGLIGAEYAATANERDAGGRVVQRVLGLPTSDELAVPGGAGGRRNSFQGGGIYWSPTTGAHDVYGLIGQCWAALGRERSFLGYPVTNEMDAPGGRINYFQHGTIYWSASTNAVSVAALNVLHMHAIRVSDSDGTF